MRVLVTVDKAMVLYLAFICCLLDLRWEVSLPLLNTTQNKQLWQMLKRYDYNNSKHLSL